ncbi:MAG: GNAT family N-acetyltransferase [Maritimibacter sp.]|nr:GNAT family N-acetyltransferase [Maritimibacter sp.]
MSLTTLPRIALTTERLTLRVPEERDFDAFAGWIADGARSHWVGGPGSRDEAREGFDFMRAHWAEKGFGYFHVALTATGRALGRVGISHPAHRAEPEVAYALYAASDEGQGYATEAARAVRDWGFGALGLPGLVSYIAPENLGSIALARRLGARAEGTTTGRDGREQIVYRHPRPEEART